MIAQDPSGSSWRVKRRWLPWRLRRRSPERLIDVGDVSGGVDDLIVGLVVLLVLIAVVVLVPVVAVLAILVAELFLLLLLLPLFVLLRAGLVARWPIEAWRGDVLVHTEAVRGWGESHRRMLELVDRIRLGDLPGPGASPSA